MLASFFKPYFFFLYSAAYSIQQTLEGLGWNGSNFVERGPSGAISNSYWSASQAVLVPLGALLVFMPILIGLQLTALRWLAGWRAFFVAILVALTPGIMSMAGIQQTLNLLPDTYVVGSGALGSGWGTFAVLIICLSLGWTLVVMITQAAKLTDRFRHGYDQVWYSLGIAAAVFFVSDLDAARRKESLKEVAGAAVGASKILLEQALQLDRQCTTGHWTNERACGWAQQVQWRLSSYASANERTFVHVGPRSEADIYGTNSQQMDEKEVDAVRLALLQYDRAQCPVTDLGNGARQHVRVSSQCQLPPVGHCSAYAERPLAGVEPSDAIIAPHAIANECIVPALVADTKRQERLSAAVESDERMRHVRWAFLLLVTVIAGGKVANASVRFVNARPLKDGPQGTTPTSPTQAAEVRTASAAKPTTKVGIRSKAGARLAATRAGLATRRADSRVWRKDVAGRR